MFMYDAGCHTIKSAISTEKKYYLPIFEQSPDHFMKPGFDCFFIINFTVTTERYNHMRRLPTFIIQQKSGIVQLQGLFFFFYLV